VTNTPVGWPADLVSSFDPEFSGQVSRWLLERLPGEFRDTEIRNDPVALSWVLKERVRNDLELMRRLFATARISSGSARPSVLLEALSEVGAQLLRAEREVNSVVGAIAALDHSKINASDLD
jgi:predicted component of type VI protein secretion system